LPEYQGERSSRGVSAAVSRGAEEQAGRMKKARRIGREE
jgi:hypothetical protein